MKHIKLFEGYLDEYYESVDDLESIDREIMDPVPYKKKIHDLLGDKWKLDGYTTKRVSFSTTHEVSKSGRYFSVLYETSLEFRIFNDEWYGVGIFKRKGSSSYEMKYVSNEYFLCDQFEGLVKLLKDKGLLK